MAMWSGDRPFYSGGREGEKEKERGGGEKERGRQRARQRQTNTHADGHMDRWTDGQTDTVS